ncbi:PREDICTED: lys-63-specific deubiquitinase BRCC36 [Tarenaya hassleriana]|uniref:lys-63-specific deubiquitinase BRCC36 n=1 Tax=Tarenaya hassleriana TaxID=28532 RepID=UPI00053C861B|nr:PREDICTED: lys-63-specific deubiquitinase BRCC36 [Tarenaya hassleriana]XP_010537983.1 PREDICTED: lys-63-specific deubiquitinase BRCC36 [Tarenaya hassleriana]
MSLTCVKMSEDVWLTCLTHALSTETEEIMGLLLGDIEYSKNGSVTALIWGASPQTRSDRQKDRVETNPEQLAAASAQAERMTISTGRTTRVIGWYHSHPHITVLPSHVDVRTQAMYQLLDSGFIGLIFSCFSEDANKVGRIQVIAFQSSDGKQNNTFKSISLSLSSKDSVIDVESSLSSSDSTYRRSYPSRGENPEQDTGDSATTLGYKAGGRVSDFGAFFVNSAEIDTSGGERTSGNYNSDNIRNTGVDIDPMEMSDGMQEAMLRSNLEMSGAEYVRKEVPLHVLPTSSLLQLNSPLTSFTDLQRVLYEEERAAYHQAILQNMRDGKVHPLTYIHHNSTYQASMCKLIEYCLSPAINALQDRLRENKIRLEMLKDEAEAMEAEALKGTNTITSGGGSGSSSHRLLHGSGSSRSRRGS